MKENMATYIPSPPPTPVVKNLQQNKYISQPSLKGRRFMKELQFKLVGAIESNNLCDIRKLIKSGVDLNCIILIHKTPLIHAIERHPKIAITFIEAGANLECAEVVARKRLPIHVAVMTGSLILVQTLLDHNANIKGQDGSGMTPLHYACYFGYQEIVSELLKRQTSQCIKAEDDVGRSAMHRAIEGKHFDIAELLFKEGGSVNIIDKSNWSPLFQCIVFNEATSIKYLLNRGANVNITDIYGNTPLHIACNPLSRDHVRTVLTTSVDYYKRTRRIPTPELQSLFFSEQGASLKIVTMLINAGADVTIRNKHGTTPIHNVRVSNIMKYLLECGSQLSISTLTNLDLSGETKLVESVQFGTEFLEQTKLLRQCRRMIRQCLLHTCDIHSAVKRLPLPQKLIEYINLLHVDSLS